MATAKALRDHIIQSLARGAKEKDMQKLLLTAGWPREIIEEYIGKVEESRPSEPGLVRLKNVSKRFGTTVVLDNVNLEIPPGELFGIIGLSGVGKTTLLNLMVGFFEPDVGEVALKLSDKTEQSISKQSELVKNMFGFAAQRPSFYGELTVRENVEHFAALYNLSPAERITRCGKLLKMVDLENAEHTLAQNLSGGMQKRLDIACALIHEPAILILDEPTADLDPIIRIQIWDLIRQINSQGTTVIVASHVVSELEQNCSRIAILRDHRITEVGTTAQLRDIYSKMYEIFLKTADKNYGPLKTYCNKHHVLFKKMCEKKDCFVVQSSEPRKALQQLLNFLSKRKDKVVHVHVDRPSIAEVFESLVKK